MIIRSWGSRGSIPVSGPQYNRYGGDTTCLEICANDGGSVIVDAGTGIRRLGKALIERGCLDVVMFFTHAHWDHILGFPFFKPVYNKDASLLIYGCPMEQGNMQTLLSRTMSTPFFPVPYEAIQANIRYQPSCLGPDPLSVAGLDVWSIPLSHPNLGMGYKFCHKGRSFVFLTDNELRHRHRGSRSYDEYVEFCRGADLLIHDAEYTPEEYPQVKGWGHSTYSDALGLAIDARVRRFGLFHHNQDRPDDDVDAILEDCRRIAAGQAPGLECLAIAHDTELYL